MSVPHLRPNPMSPTDGHEALYVLVHTPYLRPGHKWSEMFPGYRKTIIEKLERCAGLEGNREAYQIRGSSDTAVNPRPLSRAEWSDLWVSESRPIPRGVQASQSLARPRRGYISRAAQPIPALGCRWSLCRVGSPPTRSIVILVEFQQSPNTWVPAREPASPLTSGSLAGSGVMPRIIWPNTLTQCGIDRQSAAVPTASGEPVLVAVNHPSWWDLMLGFALADLLPDYANYFPIEEAMLAKYKMFRRMGAFGISPGSQGAADFLKTSRGNL